jgi:DNA-binding response OmpR family regulator
MTQGTNRILCVEDHQDTCELVTRILGLEGFKIVTANTKNEGLALCQEERFRLIIIDINLPDGTGLDLIQQIRAADGYTPIVVYSAVALKTVIEEAFKIGANDYVVKPTGWDGLITSVNRLCQHSECSPK